MENTNRLDMITRIELHPGVIDIHYRRSIIKSSNYNRAEIRYDPQGLSTTGIEEYKSLATYWQERLFPKRKST